MNVTKIRERWEFVNAVRWNRFQLPEAVAALNAAGYAVTAEEVVGLLKVCCGRRQEKPIALESDPLIFRPCRNSMRLRMAAARALLELARRGYVQ